MHADRWTSFGCRTVQVLMTAGITACGGGGGGGDGSATPAELAIIDTANAETIVGEVLEVGFDSSDFGTATNGSGILAADGGSNALVVQMAERRTIQAVGQAQPSANYGPDREDCLVSGSFTLSASLASLDTLVRGDQITIVFTSCNDGDGAIYNGRMRIDVQNFIGDLFADQYELDSKLTLTDLAITEDGTTQTANGTMNVTENLLTPLLELYSATSTRLNLRSGNFSWTGRNLTQSIDEDHRGNEWLTTSTGSGSLESSSFDGRVDYGTITPLLSIDGDYPASGVVRIDGLNGSSIVVTALNEETLQLAIDINGDTVVDETRLLDWSEVDVF